MRARHAVFRVWKKADEWLEDFWQGLKGVLYWDWWPAIVCVVSLLVIVYEISRLG